MDLYEKSMGILELPEVLELLKNEARSEAAKNLAEALRPAGNEYDVRRLLAETAAAKSMVALAGTPSFGGIKDVYAPLVRAERGGVLNTRELLDIAGVLKTARMVKDYAGDRNTSVISHLFSALRANRFLEDKITNSIAGEDEIADAASSELASIRRHMRVANARVREALQKIISSPTYAKILQEPIITLRSDRYVVPVKAEHKNSVPGLVHDISASGATVFIEPMQAVNANNEIKELQAKEKKEIERILAELSADAASYKDEIQSDFNLLTELDLIFAKAELSYKLRCCEPEISENGRLILKRARHPLLNQKTAVPIDVRLGGEFDTLVITGPNTGGKTVSLKTLGLLSLMTQCGLHIPADDGSVVPIYGRILADIGDEQSIEQSLSTFSSHMTNIVGILGEADENTLLLFDELGAGTDPVEGAALAIAIIEYARNRGADIAATTHYAELKMYAMTEKGVQNASCEFDVQTLKPTYKLLIGIPGKSNAFAISERLGIPKEVIEDAAQRVDSEDARFEEVLTNLEEQRQQMEKDRLEARRLLRETEENAKRSQEDRKVVEAAREKAVQLAQREARAILEDARRSAENVFSELDEMRRKKDKNEDWQNVNEARALLRHGLNEAEAKLGASPKEEAEPLKRPLRPGDRVEILGMGTRAEVVSVGTDGNVSLRAGIMNISAKQSELKLLEGIGASELKRSMKIAQNAETKLRTLNVKPELDIRGMTSEEAVLATEQFLDSVLLAKLSTVTVIHGKGTGALRSAVQACLRKNSNVKSFRLGRYGEGEDGVTVIEMK